MKTPHFRLKIWGKFGGARKIFEKFGGVRNIFEKFGGVRKIFEKFGGVRKILRFPEKSSYPPALIKNGRPLTPAGLYLFCNKNFHR